MSGERTLPILEVSIDGDRCCGAGHCVRVVPEVFDQDDDDGTVILLEPHPPPCLGDAIREAAAVCPTNVIVLTERV